MAILWLNFVIATLAILYSGARLSIYGDIIAEKSGLGRTWVGVVLMASVTSLPELATGLSSVIYTHTPDIAAGDILGSCAFNMLILAALDAVVGPIPLSSRAHQGQTLAAGFGILLLSLVALSACFNSMAITVGWIGLYSILFILIYLVAMRLIFFYEKQQRAAAREKAIGLKYGDIPKRTAYLGYSIHAVLVIIAGTCLPGIGKGIAETTGLGQTFVGNIFIAAATSLPEVVVSVSAVKMNAIDLAIGNLFGSNLFNIAILALDDIFFVEGPLLSFVHQNHLISALSAIAMTAIAIIGLTYRAGRKRLFLAWDSVGIVLVYLVNLMLLYTKR